MQRHLFSLAAGALFVGLALGSGSTVSDGPGEPPDVTSGDGMDPAIQDPAPDVAGDQEEAAPSGGYPTTDEGDCCCDYLEADRPVQFFQPEAQCLQMAGTCLAELGPCVEANARLEAQADQCCCAATETIVAIDSPCEGECYEFFEEGDTPGSCVY